MRIAVISDIHANLHALEAVLAAIDTERADELWCLGDLVGYGPKPNECVALVRERASTCLVGNHDLAVLEQLELELFTDEAAAAAAWSRGVLEPDAAAFLGSLAPAGRREGVALAHGSPRDPVWEYVLSAAAGEAALAATAEPLVLVGHSHVALALGSAEDGVVAGGKAPAGTAVALGAGRRHVLNPGSVGQPRDGDPRAAWIVIDGDSGWATFCRTDYPIESTQSEMRALPLPEVLAERLAHGV
ncbi:MAG: metallophosphatase family protein [Gaiellaceae bacterium MAG52_C11]|nr:metallophosphatase family protein [Candidatus Gaiellasilicea maunaloa]